MPKTCPAALLLVLVAGSGITIAQSTPAAGPAPKLQAYTTPDKSASAGVPAGWKVSTGANTVIIMNGPQNETINLGATFVVRNAPFEAGKKPAGGGDVSIPNSTNLGGKLTMVFENSAAVTGGHAPNVKILSSAAIDVPSSVGQCGRLRASVTDKTGQPTTLAALMCSLPVDAGGTYKIMFKMAEASPDVATREADLASAVFASYRIPPALLQNKIAPFYVPPVVAAAQTQAMMAQTAAAAQASLVSANCFDLTVLRETPKYLLPRACGGPR
jgi:hypothetical protein